MDVATRAALSAAIISAAGMQVALAELAKIRATLLLPGTAHDAPKMLELRVVLIEESLCAQQEWIDSLWIHSGLFDLLGPSPRLTADLLLRRPDPQ